MGSCRRRFDALVSMVPYPALRCELPVFFCSLQASWPTQAFGNGGLLYFLNGVVPAEPLRIGPAKVATRYVLLVVFSDLRESREGAVFFLRPHADGTLVSKCEKAIELQQPREFPLFDSDLVDTCRVLFLALLRRRNRPHQGAAGRPLHCDGWNLSAPQKSRIRPGWEEEESATPTHAPMPKGEPVPGDPEINRHSSDTNAADYPCNLFRVSADQGLVLTRSRRHRGGKTKGGEAGNGTHGTPRRSIQDRAGYQEGDKGGAQVVSINAGRGPFQGAVSGNHEKDARKAAIPRYPCKRQLKRNAMESFLYSLYYEHSATTLSTLADYATLATFLHQHTLPPVQCFNIQLPARTASDGPHRLRSDPEAEADDTVEVEVEVAGSGKLGPGRVRPPPPLRRRVQISKALMASQWDRHYPAIFSQGLKAGGMRQDIEITVYFNIEAALQEGYPVHQSGNGVILTGMLQVMDLASLAIGRPRHHGGRHAPDSASTANWIVERQAKKRREQVEAGTYNPAMGPELEGCVILSIDLSKAFDMVDRSQFETSLRKELSPPESAPPEVSGRGADLHRPSGRFFPPSYLKTFKQMPTLAYTAFADDTLGHWRVRSLRDLELFAARALALLGLLRRYGLKLNEDKSQLLFRLQGSAAAKVLQLKF
ncbi:hypothetical protein AK812_SmicGene38489 [Symbiodinium microadriaticum]|uniref:Reverse transcriptase domain-containing protein n=1 Tax=Symbiodinium microadriaticum TaxID=2951 RepID=A0A1Q9CDN5_SYMMI|nr:hypothetical protein AK812_SmicGene38489 [Symbiodinium microadriaticum]